MTAPLAKPAQGTPLIGAGEPAPVEVVNADGRARVVFICDHASNRVPAALGTLGLDRAALGGHIAWDIGAAEVARLLSKRFDAPLVLSGYSRLVIDCNRPLDDPTSIAETSDGVPVPGNESVAREAAAARADACFHPYHDAIDTLLAARRDKREQTVIVSVHSFTPSFGGFERPWQVGVLWGEDGRLALPFMDAIEARGGVTLGDNEPYSARENFGYSMERHGVREGRPHMLIELRQDLIADADGAARWAEIAGDGIEAALASLEL